MATRSSGKRAAVLVMLFWLAAALWPVAAGTALAALSPKGLVDDQAGVLTPTQLTGLENGLTGLHYQYRVVILPQAFPGATPSDAAAQFQAQASRIFVERQLSAETVLIAVAMKERLVDFEVLRSGNVNREFQERTGAEFGAVTPDLVAAFGPPARAGDIAGGILAAARTAEGMAGFGPGPTPRPGPLPAPVPVPFPGTSPVPAPAPVPYQISTPVPDEAVPSGAFWLLAGIAGGGTGIIYLVRLGAFRSRRRTTGLQADALAAGLQSLERELPEVRKYRGETAALVGRVEAALAEVREAVTGGEAAVAEADRLAHRARFAGAIEHLALADIAYGNGATRQSAAQEAWKPVLQALSEGDALLSDLQGQAAQAVNRLSGEQMRTGRPLTRLEERIGDLRAALPPARQGWLADPVTGFRQATQLRANCQAILADLAALPELEATLATREADRQRAAAAVAEARGTQSLRFVEAAPEERLEVADGHAAIAAAALAEGDAAAARTALNEAAVAVAAADEIVTRHLEALRLCPVKRAELAQELPALAALEREATATVAELSGEYHPDDWADVATVPDRLARFQAGLQAGLAEADHLTDPAVQRLLAAHQLLNDLLAERDQLHAARSSLRARPTELAAAAQQAAAHLQAAANVLELAERQVAADALILPPELTGATADARSSLADCQALGQQRPLPARRWAQLAEALSQTADQVQQGVLQLAAQAADARAALAQARGASARTLGYTTFDLSGSGPRLQSALAMADDALALGRYAEVLARTQEAVMLSQLLEQAYFRHLEAEREREEQQRRAQESLQQPSMSNNVDSSGGFGGGSSGGGGNDSSPTSGGGGNW